MATIQIDLTKTVKPMKPMHAGGQPPLGGKNMVGYFHYLTEAGIPYSRLHDVGGPFGAGKFVDIPNVFRDFDADENDPANYDFTFTDHLLKHLVAAGVEPYYRLGTTIENQALIKAYHTVPPKDYAKWARICEHVILHYTEGWADGFHYNIRYWEIWNEPEVQDQMMWNGTEEQYLELYEVASKYLKSRFPHLKIGGYASCGFYAIVPRTEIDPETNLPGTIPPSDHAKKLIRFFYKFFDYIKEHDCPIDFFSWHSYASSERICIMDQWIHDELEKLGYGGLEVHLNEWNPFYREFGTAHHSAEIAATMMGLQHGHTDVCCIYDMRTNTSPYCPLFDICDHKPIHGYYALVAFNKLYQLKNQVETVSDTKKVYALAASNGKRHAMMICNLSGKTQPLKLEGVELTDARFYVLDQQRLLSWAPNANEIENNAVVLVEW